MRVETTDISMVSMAELTEILGLSRSTINSMVADGTFPAPIKIGLRRIAWRSTTVEDWLEEREALG